MDALTQKQRDIYQFISTFFQKSGDSPTTLEIAKAMNFQSLRTVTQYLDILERKGFIRRLRHQRRGIRLIESTMAVELVTLPVLASVGCDNASVFAEGMIDEYVTITNRLLNGIDPTKVFVFRAAGESMFDAGVKNGNYVLVEKTNNIQEGDLVVAIVDAMAVLKKITFSPNAIILNPVSSDPAYQPIILRRDFEIFGKLIEIIRMHNEVDVVMVPIKE